MNPRRRIAQRRVSGRVGTLGVTCRGRPVECSRPAAGAHAAWRPDASCAVSWPDARDPRQADARRHRGALVRARGRPTASTASTARPSGADVFSIDTPPPTVSGSIHMGTVFGYTQTDAIARHRRMAGKSVFFPIGWDDNGLATERRVQNYYGVRCDPSQPYDAGFQPPFRGDAPKDHQEIPISRPNFVELCHELTATDEAVFEDLFRRLGPVLRLVAEVRDDQRRQPAHEPAGVPAQPRPRRGLQRRGADGVGRRRPHGRRPGRDRGPRAARRLPPAGVPRARRRRA